MKPLVLTVRSVLFAAVFLAAAWAQAPANGAGLRFEDYSVAVSTIRKPAPIRIDDADTRRYATQLRTASHHTPDFAGHYILASWGCGASCVMAAAIDAQTGAVTRLPFTVSAWPLDVTEPFSYRRNSRLLIVQGSRDEKGSGTYYYELAGHTFKLLSETEAPR